MKVSSNEEIGTWIEANGKHHYCFGHESTINTEDMRGEEVTTFTASYVVLEKKDEAKAKKMVKNFLLENMTVTVSSGKVFMTDPKSRQDLSDAIMTAQTLGKTKTMWKLAKGQEPRWQEITLQDAIEAIALAIQKKGEIIADV